MYNFTEDDLQTIIEVINEGGKIWENKKLLLLKRKIKNYYRFQILQDQCCYCRRPTTGEFNMVLDIEHVLPKGKYRNFMFRSFNLSVSCKRCNMEIKGEDDEFVIKPIENDIMANDSDNYLILHPNFDIYFNHLSREVIAHDNFNYTKYVVINDSEKGQYTYEYFELSKFEIDNFDQAQGIKDTRQEYSEQMDSETIKQIEDLLSDV